MQHFEQIEEPINKLATILAENTDRKFTRKIKVTTEIRDISVRNKTVRVHPEQIQDKDLVSLILHIFSLCDEFDKRHLTERQACILRAKERVTQDLAYIFRREPEAMDWILDLAQDIENGQV